MHWRKEFPGERFMAIFIIIIVTNIIMVYFDFNASASFGTNPESPPYLKWLPDSVPADEPGVRL